MQTGQPYKLRPNKSQSDLMAEWLVTLRKHRNYALRERIDSYQQNNLHNDTPVTYAYGAFCDVDTRIEYGSTCPLTCAVVKHGVVSVDALTKTARKTGVVSWDGANGIQGKRTTQLRRDSYYFGRVDSSVLQQNLANLNTAFNRFFKGQSRYPAFRNTSNFKSFKYPGGRVKFDGNHVTIPGIGRMRFFDSRPFPKDAKLGSVTIKREADGWYIVVLVSSKTTDLPTVKPTKELKSNVSIDVGINKLISLTDGSHIENPKFATNKAARRRMRIRQRRVNRKVKGSNNRSKAGVEVAKLHKKTRNKREAYQWKAAAKVVNTAESIGHEDLKIKNMKARCKAKKSNGRFMPNGQSAKRGLNRSISDAAWGDLFEKIAWLAAKSGKPVFKYAPHHTSQECSACGHKSPNNRDGEKFVCESCGHIDHADTQAARNGQKRLNLNFVSNRHKKPSHKSLVPTRGLRERNALVCNDSAVFSEQNQAGNWTSKGSDSTQNKTKRSSRSVVPETQILDDIA